MIHVLINPAGAGGRTIRYWNKLEDRFRESGQPYEVHLSRSEADLAEICRTLSAVPPVDLVVVGGDGTINQVLNAIPGLSAVRLGIIPCGSGNDLAKDLSLPADGREIVRTILQGKARRKSDVGLVELLGEDGRILQSRRFLTGCGFGFDAAVCHGVEVSPLKGILNRLHLGKLIYIAVAIRMIFSFRQMPVEISCVRSTEGAAPAAAAVQRAFPHCLLLAAMNHRFQGGGFLFAPDASAEDGQHDVSIADPKNRLDFFPIFPTAYRGEHVKFDCVTMLRTPDITMRTQAPQWVHTDGEPFAQASCIRIRILPERLSFLV